MGNFHAREQGISRMTKASAKNSEEQGLFFLHHLKMNEFQQLQLETTVLSSFLRFKTNAMTSAIVYLLRSNHYHTEKLRLVSNNLGREITSPHRFPKHRANLGSSLRTDQVEKSQGIMMG